MELTEQIKNFVFDHYNDLNFSFASVAIIDFKQAEYSAKSFYLPEFQTISNDLIYDLASLTKPLTLGLARLAKAECFNANLDLLLQHRAGLPAFGRLSGDSWQEHLLSFDLSEAPELYSDYSALRAMLEFDQCCDISMQELCEKFYADDIKFWKKLSLDQQQQCVITGERGKELIQGQVHDPNAFNIGSFCSHAGLFATIDGIANALLRMQKEFNFLKVVSERINPSYRFVDGFDTVQDLEKTLAGVGCGSQTFGHLGFTGTSFWIDVEKELGWILLSNATENFWFERKFLHQLRRHIGQLVWSGSQME